MRLTGRPGPSRARLAAAVAAAVLGAGASRASAAPFVYVTDALSAAVSQYDAGGPSLAPLVPPTVGTGVAPLGVAVSPGRHLAPTVTTPEPATRAAVRDRRGRRPDARAIRVAPACPGRRPAWGEPRRPQRLRHRDRRQPGRLQYTVTASGALTPKGPSSVPTPPGPQRLAVSPDSRSVYVTTTVTGLSTVAQYTAAADGALSSKSPASLPVGGDPFAEPIGAAVSPDGRSVYVADAAGRRHAPGPHPAVHGCARRGAEPQVARDRGRPAGRRSASRWPPDGRACTPPTPRRSARCCRTPPPPTGTLTPKSPGAVPAGSFPLGVAASADGRAVYAAAARRRRGLAVHRRGGRGPDAPVTGGGRGGPQPGRDRRQPDRTGPHEQGPVQGRRLEAVRLPEPGPVHRLRQPRPVAAAATRRRTVPRAATQSSCGVLDHPGDLVAEETSSLRKMCAGGSRSS